MSWIEDNFDNYVDEDYHNNLKNRIVSLLVEAKEKHHTMKGDQIGGFHFVGTFKEGFTKRLKDICNSNNQNFQEIELDFSQCIIESGITLNR